MLLLMDKYSIVKNKMHRVMMLLVYCRTHIYQPISMFNTKQTRFEQCAT